MYLYLLELLNTSPITQKRLSCPPTFVTYFSVVYQLNKTFILFTFNTTSSKMMHNLSLIDHSYEYVLCAHHFYTNAATTVSFKSVHVLTVKLSSMRPLAEIDNKTDVLQRPMHVTDVSNVNDAFRMQTNAYLFVCLCYIWSDYYVFLLLGQQRTLAYGLPAVI